MRKWLFWVGLLLGLGVLWGLAMMLASTGIPSSEYWLFIFGIIFIPLAGGSLGFMVGDLIDVFRADKRIAKIKKRWFWGGFVIGVVLLYLMVLRGYFFSRPADIFLGCVVGGILFGMIGYTMGTLINDRRRWVEAGRPRRQWHPFWRFPTTRLGWWSFGFCAAFFVWIVLSTKYSYVWWGNPPWQNPVYRFLSNSFIYSTEVALVLGLIAVIRKKERTVGVFLSIIPGLFFIYAVLANL